MASPAREIRATLKNFILLLLETKIYIVNQVQRTGRWLEWNGDQEAEKREDGTPEGHGSGHGRDETGLSIAEEGR
jgi:hypothetical protein